MLQIKVKGQAAIQGEVRVPGDKSISHRSALFGAVAHGETKISGFLPGEDCLSTLSCLRQLGVEVIREGETDVRVVGKGWQGLREPQQVLDVGNSGTTIRLLLGLLAGSPFHVVLTGDASIAKRPMKRVLQPLMEMGVRCDARQGGDFTPISLRGGKLSPISYRSTVSSAQLKSAVLLASLQAEGESQYSEPSLSRDHTERMLQAFGVNMERQGSTVRVKGPQPLQAAEVRVPGDISSAAFFMVAAAILPGSRLWIRDVGINPTRSGIVEVMREMGATIEVTNERTWGGESVADLYVEHSVLRGTRISGSIIPRLIDEIPIIALLATQAQGETIIANAEELRIKETDRIATVCELLESFGANVTPTDDGMIIHGTSPLHGATVSSRGDHRIGMTAYVAALVALGESTLEEVEAIRVSFPEFEKKVKNLVGIVD